VYDVFGYDAKLYVDFELVVICVCVCVWVGVHWYVFACVCNLCSCICLVCAMCCVMIVLSSTLTDYFGSDRFEEGGLCYYE